MSRLIVLTLFAINLVIVAGVVLQRAAKTGNPMIVPLAVEEEIQLPQLILSSERPESKRANLEPVLDQQVKPGLVSGASLGRACISLGQFETLAEAELIRGVLEPLTAFFSIRESVMRHETGHWVLVPPLRSREAALAVVEQLIKAGFHDSYVVPNGDKARAISLGVFQREQGAHARKAQIDSLGLDIDVVIAMEAESVPGFSLDLELADGADDVLLSNIVDGYGDLSWHATACPL
jgi:hypothetical protein